MLGRIQIDAAPALESSSWRSIGDWRRPALRRQRSLPAIAAEPRDGVKGGRQSGWTGRRQPASNAPGAGGSLAGGA